MLQLTVITRPSVISVFQSPNPFQIQLLKMLEVVKPNKPYAIPIIDDVAAFTFEVITAIASSFQLLL